jgi:hypothetical protein
MRVGKWGAFQVNATIAPRPTSRQWTGQSITTARGGWGGVT